MQILMQKLNAHPVKRKFHGNQNHPNSTLYNQKNWHFPYGGNRPSAIINFTSGTAELPKHEISSFY